jgi:hypothetical protein
MEVLGINGWLLLFQVIPVILIIGLPVISLIDLKKTKLSGTPLAIWTLIICAVPLLGSLAYWILKPHAAGER